MNAVPNLISLSPKKKLTDIAKELNTQHRFFFASMLLHALEARGFSHP